MCSLQDLDIQARIQALSVTNSEIVGLSLVHSLWKDGDVSVLAIQLVSLATHER